MARLLTCAPPLLAPAVNSPPSQCFRLQKKYFIYMKMNLTNVAEKKSSFIFFSAFVII